MAYCTRSAKKTSGYYAALHTRSTADLYSDDHAATLSAAVPPRRDEDNVFEVDRLITEGSHAFCTLNLLIQRNFQGAGQDKVPRLRNNHPHTTRVLFMCVGMRGM